MRASARSLPVHVTVQSRLPTRARRQGFTLVELVMTIVVVSVLAVTAVPRLFDLASVDARGFRDETLTALRYARRLAIASGCDVQFAIGPAGYALATRGVACDTGAFSSPVDHPTRPGAFVGSPPSELSVGTVTVRFDRIGRPRDGSGSPLGAPASVAIGGYSLTVEPETGFARAS